jgi:hypothetical protein
VRQPPRPLRLEVEQAVGQRRAVVLDGLRRRGAVAPAVVEEERRQQQQEEEPHRRGGAAPAHGQRQARTALPSLLRQ